MFQLNTAVFESPCFFTWGRLCWVTANSTALLCESALLRQPLPFPHISSGTSGSHCSNSLPLSEMDMPKSIPKPECFVRFLTTVPHCKDICRIRSCFGESSMVGLHWTIVRTVEVSCSCFSEGTMAGFPPLLYITSAWTHHWAAAEEGWKVWGRFREMPELFSW